MSKIIVDRVEIKNFLSYGNKWTEIDFQSGINVVLGNNKDMDRSNGAGKTSFLEAIPYALFGQTNKGVALSKIVNWKNGKKCEVRLHFHKNGVPYIVHRGHKPGILTLFQEGVEVPKLADKRMFQQELENDLSGMDFRAAQALLFQNANNMVSMFNTPKAEKRKFIDNFFNLVIYSQALDVTNAKLRNLENNLREIAMERDFKQRTIDDLSQKISSFVPVELSDYEGNVVSLQADYGTLLDNNPDIEERHGYIEDMIVVTKSNRDEMATEIYKVKEKIGDVRLEIRTFNTEVKTKRERYEAIGDLSDQKEKLMKVKDALTKFENVGNELDSCITKIEEVEEKKNKVEMSFRESQIYAEQTRNEINTLKHQLENPEDFDENLCPTCYQNVDPNHIKHHLESCIAGLQRELTAYGGEQSNLQGQITRYDIQLEGLNKKATELEDKVNKKHQLEQALAKLSGVEEKELELNELEQRITEIETVLLPQETDKEQSLMLECEQMEGELQEIQAELTRYEEQLEKTKHTISVIRELSGKLDAAESILENQREIRDRLVGENEANIASKKQLEDEIVSTQKEVTKLEKMKDYLEHIKFTLKDENVKQYAISNMVPFIQQQTNHYLSDTGHSYYVELDNWLDGEIKGFGVGDCDFGNMSGGEGKSIDLALKFAMMDVARRQAGSYLDVLVLDELLDSSIDSFGLEKTMDIVRLKQHEDNLKVFIVSHREEVAGFGPDRIYQVTKEDGLSTIDLING